MENLKKQYRGVAFDTTGQRPDIKSRWYRTEAEAQMKALISIYRKVTHRDTRRFEVRIESKEV